jgi:hypothetical protein
MLIGQGTINLDECKIGTTAYNNFPAGEIELHWIPPSLHGGKIGYIETTHGIHEDVVTSVEVDSIDLSRSSNDSFFGRAYAGDHEYGGKEMNYAFTVGKSVLVLGDRISGVANHNRISTITQIYSNTVVVQSVANDGGNPWYQLVIDDDGWRGWFDAVPAMKKATRIELDFVFPQGMYWTDEDGDYRRRYAFIKVEVQEIDANGVPVGLPNQYNYSYSASSANQKRITERIYLAPARYRVRVKRDDRDDAKSSEMSKCFWAAMRCFCAYNIGDPAYGDVTLMAVKMKAGAKLAAAAASKISVKASRVIETVASDFAVTSQSRNPVDAFAYVARLGGDQDGLDMPLLKSIEPKWAGTNGFNYRFESLTTIYDALQTIAGSHRAFPEAYDRKIGLRLDRQKTVDEFLVTEEQMLKESYSVGIRLSDNEKIDGFRISYRDPQSPNNLSVLWPLSAVSPERIDLNGCTDAATALAMAKYLHAKRLGTTRIVTFDTEYDAHMFKIGSRIAVLHPLINFISGARVLSYSGLAVTIDSVPQIQGACRVTFRTQEGRAMPSLDGTVVGNVITLAQAPAEPIFGPFDGQEATSLAIGISDAYKRSYVVQEIAPAPGSISVKCVTYNGAEYAFPIPGET